MIHSRGVKIVLSLLMILSFTIQSDFSFALEGNVVLLKNKEYYSELRDKIEQAKDSIYLTVFLFKTTDKRGNLPRKVVYSLIDAAKRKVETTVLLEDGGSDQSLKAENRSTAAILKKGGVKVIFDSPEKTTHVKAAVIDERHVFIGSHNLTHSALSRNNELSVYIDSPQLANQVLKYFKGI